MLSKLFWAGVLVSLACFALAQDPTKVEPKHYKLDFENDRVQVVSVHYGPHEKSALHDHPGGVVVTSTEVHLRFTDETGKTREVFAKPAKGLLSSQVGIKPLCGVRPLPLFLFPLWP